MKDAFYFPHDSNAHGDKLLVKLRRLHGYAGVGIYWTVIEKLRDENASSYELPLDAIDDMAYECQFERGPVDFMLEIGLLQTDNGVFWSNSLKRRMKPLDEKRHKLSEAGKKGGRPPGYSPIKAETKPGLNQVKTTPKPAESNKSRVEESKSDKSKEDKELPKPLKKKKNTPLGEDWKPTDNHRQLAEKLGINLEWQVDQFRDHALANNRKQADWDRSFNNWLRKSLEFTNREAPPAPKPKPQEPNFGKWTDV